MTLGTQKNSQQLFKGMTKIEIDSSLATDNRITCCS